MSPRLIKHVQTVIVFFFGVLIGIKLALLLHNARIKLQQQAIFDGVTFTVNTIAPKPASSAKTDEFTENPYDQLYQQAQDLNASHIETLIKDFGSAQARQVAEHVRVLCWVLTHPKNLQKKAWHVRATWGRRCNKLLFVSEETDGDLPIIKVSPSRTGRDGLWSKTVQAFKYIHEHHRDEYDWVLKADDDTYVIMENLRSMLLPYNPRESRYFGYQYKPWSSVVYMSGGAGYVLSHEAVDRLVPVLNNTSSKQFDQNGCLGQKFSMDEDVAIAQCLCAAGVLPDDSRDYKGRHRFFPMSVGRQLSGLQIPVWLYTYSYWPVLQGEDCCSDTPVSFHYVSPDMLYMMEYLVYHVRPFPVNYIEKSSTQFNISENNSSMLTANQWKMILKELKEVHSDEDKNEEGQ